jgi:hypothetical protein
MPFQPWVGIDATLTVPVNLQGAATTNPVFGASVIGDAFNRVELRAGGTIAFGNGTVTPTTTLLRVAGPILQSNAALDVNAIGQGLQVAEGANAKQGTAVLAAGSAVVANTSVTASSRILLTSNLDGGTPGFVRVSARTAGTSFTITSSSGTDTSTIAYEIFEPG